MRRFVLPLTALVVSLLSVGCGEDKKSEDRTIALVVGIANEPFYKNMIKGAQAKADALGVKLIVKEPARWNVDDQTAVVDEVIAAGADALIIAPVDKEKMVAPLKKAHDAGMKVFTVDTFIGENRYGQGGEADFPLAFIGSDNYEGGKLACDSIARSIGESGKVYIQNVQQGISSTDARQKGCEDILQTYPNVQVVAVDFTGKDQAVAKSQTEAQIAEHPDLKGIFGTNVESGIGAGQAVAALGKGDAIEVVVFDAPSGAITELKNNTLDGCLAQKPALMGEMGVDFSVKALDGATDLPKKVSTGFVLINRSNVDNAEIAQFIY